MASSSLKDHLHCSTSIHSYFILVFLCYVLRCLIYLDANLSYSNAAPEGTSLPWQTRIQITIDVANTLLISMIFTIYKDIKHKQCYPINFRLPLCILSQQFQLKAKSFEMEIHPQIS